MSSTRPVPLLALRSEKTGRSGRSFSSATSAIRRRRCGRRSPIPRICANGLRSILTGTSATVGTAKLSTVGAPTPQVSETTVKRAEAPRLLEYSWGGNDLRWELEPLGSGTRLTLWHNIDRRFISLGAAGWHICFDVLDRLLAGEPIGRIVGADAMKFDGWQRLNAEYAKQFGVETPGWPPNAPKR